MRMVAALLLFALSGCSRGTSLIVTPPSVQALQQLTAADLQQAVLIAATAAPPDVEAATCYSFLLLNLGALNAPIPQASGAVSAFEVGRLGYQKMNGMSPMGNVPLEQACGPLALNVMGGIAGLLQQMGVSAALTTK